MTTTTAMTTAPQGSGATQGRAGATGQLSAVPQGAASRSTRALQAAAARTAAQLAQLQLRVDAWNATQAHATATLDVLDAKLALLEDTAVPVQRAAARLDKVRRNLDVGLVRLGDVLDYIDLPARLEPIVARGPQDGMLDDYLRTAAQLTDALGLLSRSRSKASAGAASALAETLATCASQLQSLFRRTLAVVSTPVDPLTLPQLVHGLRGGGVGGSGAGNGGGTVTQGVALIDDAHLTTLRAVASELARLAEYRPTALRDAIAAYQSSRSFFLAKSLAYLRTPVDKLVAELGSAASTASGDVSGSGGGTSGSIATAARSTRHLATTSTSQGSRATPQQALDAFAQYATTLFRMLHAECNAASSLFVASDTVRTALQDTVSTCVTQFLDTFESTLACAADGTQLLELNAIQCVQALEEEYSSSVMAMCGGPVAKITERRKAIMERVAKSLKEVLDMLLSEATSKNASLTADGTVHEMSSRTLTRLKNLAGHAKVMSIIIRNSSVLDGPDFAWYCGKVIVHLQESVNNRSKLYKKRSLGLIFLLNNHHFIQRESNSPSLAPYISADVQDALEAEWSKTRQAYQDMLNKLAEIVIDTPPIIPKGLAPKSITKTQKEAIKDRFKAFNDAVDDLVESYRDYSVPDRDLHSLVINDLTSSLVPLYTIFLGRYSAIDFTKNRDKYVKYTVESLESTVKTILK